MKKRYKNYKSLVKAAIKNTTPPLTEQEQLYKNILVLSGIPRPSNELVRVAYKKAVKEQ